MLVPGGGSGDEGNDDPPATKSAVNVLTTLPPPPQFELATRGDRLFGSGIADEFIRAGLAILFAFIFLLTIILSFLHLGGKEWASTKDWLQLLLPAETALIGSATGFYFGARKGDKPSA